MKPQDPNHRPRRREYQLPIVRELYPTWHPLAGRVIELPAAPTQAPRLRRPISPGVAAPGV
jgi:hypothetical protein